MMMHPPGPRGSETLAFVKGRSLGNTLSFLKGMAERYGSFSSLRLLHKRIYLVDDVDLVREVLITRQHEFVRDAGATLLRELVGDGLLTREEPLHKERRRVLQPAFHRDQIPEYAKQMVEITERMMARWNDGEQVNVAMAMRQLTLSIVGAALFGTNLQDSADQIAEAVASVIRKASRLGPLFAFAEPAALAYRRLFPKGPSLLFQRERSSLERTLTPILKQRRQLESGGRDILSLILQAGDEELTDEAVRNELVTFVLAGHETTATALTWTWHLLAQHRRVEEALYDELDRNLQGRAPTIDDLPRLPYATAVVNEALRLYPPAALFARRPKQDLLLGGYRIRAGQSIFISPYVTGRNKRYFQNPDEFTPERWASYTGPKLANFPFGAGAKSCIGEGFARTEAILVLATIAKRWRLELIEGGPNALITGPVLPQDRSFPLRLRARAVEDEQRREQRSA